MKRALAILGALVLLLGLADRWLARRAAEGLAAGRVGPLFTPEEAERLRKQPALRIEGGGEVHAYGRVEGRWRCLSYHEAPADARAVQELLEGVAGAEGIVHASGTEAAPAYGLNTPRTLRVSIQGPRATQDPGGDVLATLELGTSTPQGGFVRRKGTPEIWSIASDLRAPLERRLAPGLPPLLEPAVVPQAWLASGGVVALTLEEGARRLELVRRDAPPDPESAGPGALPWRWVLLEGGAELRLDVEAGEAFLSYVTGLPYLAVEPRTARASAGLVPPRALVTLRGREGPPLVLALGASDAAGSVALWVEASQTLFRIAPAALALLLPSRETLTAEYPEDDPWTTALREERR
ncbi:MAG TPA: DUF4340 domain-containing protein [Planctomycetota bacterium]